MTIVAGFHCRDGIVLCADTQELIREYLKVDTPKIEIRPQGIQHWDKPLWAAFAGSGTAPLIDKLIELMWEAANRMPPVFGETSKAMEEANKNYHQELATMYQASDPYYPRAEILYALSADGQMGLFKANGPIVTKVRDYAPSGAGDILAKYICKRMYPRLGGMEVKEAVILAVYMLDQTKGNVEGCGGESHIVVVRPNSSPEYVLSKDVVEASIHLHNLEIAANRLLLNGANMELSDETFESELTTVMNMTRHSRQQRKDWEKQLLGR